jgi:hypothetical protein
MRRHKTEMPGPEYLPKSLPVVVLAGGMIPPFAEESLVRCAVKMPVVPIRNRESATAVRVRKSSGNKKLVLAAPKLGRRVTPISGARVDALKTSRKTAGA